MEGTSIFASALEHIYTFHALKTVLLVVLLAILFKNLFAYVPLKNYPRGPRGWPIVGYLPYINDHFHKDLINLEKTYGKIFSLKFGSKRVVILNDFNAIKEANFKDEFAGRPPRFFQFSENTENLGTMSEHRWKESRRFLFSSLRTLGMGKNRTEEYIMGQITTMLQDMENHTGRDVDIKDVVHQAVNNTILYLTFGKTLTEESKKMANLIETFSNTVFEYVTHYEKAMYFPVLRPLVPFLNPRVRECRKVLDEMEELMWKEISLRRNSPADFPPEDYMSLFLAEMNKRKDNPSTFTDQVLSGNNQVLLLAGSDTIKASLDWTLLLLAKYPDIQEKAHRELVEVLGENRLPCWEDRHILPYLEALIMEVSRFKTLGPLADPHWTLKDTTVQTFSIPEGTVIINNLYAVHNDPKLFPEPDVFRPERFLINNGEKCKAPEFLIPFNIGKRMCPGEKLANMQVFLFLASMIQRFKFSEPSGGVNLDEQIFIVLYPVSTKIRIERRM